MASNRKYGVPDDDTPELTPATMARGRSIADIAAERGIKGIGRPKSEVTKQPVNLRLDPEIVAYFKAGGDGWQTRINAVLSKHVKAANAASRRKQAS